VTELPSGQAADELPKNWRIEVLSGTHDLRGFVCGVDFLDKYITQHARRNQEMGYGRTYVALDATSRVCGYSTIAMGNVHFEHLPDDLSRRVPRYPMPVALLGCLAVTAKYQRCGLGRLLLVDAMRRIVEASEIIAARAVEVLAINEEARNWYQKFGFLPFRDNELHLYLPMHTVKEVVHRSG
jgi:ribosomal protein S18 acetylase RimI-like enzyme